MWGIKEIGNYPYTVFGAGYREIYIKGSGLGNYFYTIFKVRYREMHIKGSGLKNHFYTVYRARYREIYIKGSGSGSFIPLQSSLAKVVYKGK